MANKFLLNYRGPMRMVGVGVATSIAEAESAVPTISSGSGAPSAAEPNGSLYMRTDASNADDALYSRIAGAWVALDGAP
jgi:hypothetical protein